MKLKDHSKLDSNILKVRKVTFEFDGILFEGYTADEPDPDRDGKFLNYCSSLQAADSIGKHHDTTAGKRMSKALKALLGKDFTTTEAVYKNSQGGHTFIKLWRPKHIVIYWIFNVFKGNRNALNKIVALATASLDQIIDDEFGRTYKNGDLKESARKHLDKEIERAYTKLYWNDLKAQVVCYYSDSESNMDVNSVMVNIANQINVSQFGKDSETIASEIKAETGITAQKIHIRDYMNPEALERIKFLELTTTKLIANDGYVPREAIEEAIRIAGNEIMDYRFDMPDFKLEKETSIEAIERNLDRNIKALQWRAERNKLMIARKAN